MNQYLLRIEGVNLSAVLYDTSELSVKRGSSLMLRQAVDDIDEVINELESISTGASIGLFMFKAESPDNIKKRVISELNNKYPHHTFVVDHEVYEDEQFKDNYELIIAKNRFRQFQQLTFSSPKVVDNNPSIEGKTIAICKKNQHHPASGIIQKGNTKFAVSESVGTRFKYGKTQRQNIYNHELGDDIKTFKFTDDLHDIARKTEKYDFGNLNDKIAVIYLDGNSFSSFTKDCKTSDELKNFDAKNQKYRKDFLKQLVDTFATDNIEHRIFLETLLWGGDEMILIVPAGMGMETIQMFYKLCKTWKYNGKNLTYAGGIVFSHYKTPISQLTKAATQLADAAKEKSRTINSFNYLVLESIDYPTQDINTFWTLRYGNAANKIPPLFPNTDINTLNQFLKTLPKRSIYNIAKQWLHHWSHHSGAGSHSKLIDAIERLKKTDKDAYQILFENVFPVLTNMSPLNESPEEQYKNAAWVHLVELWDYLDPENKSEQDQISANKGDS